MSGERPPRAPRQARARVLLCLLAAAAAAPAAAPAAAAPAGAAAASWAREPSCDELLAMWRFSKRQSRAAEVSNEVVHYRDPFAYNVWEPHARARSAGPALKVGRGGGPRHVYGRVVHAAPRARGGVPSSAAAAAAARRAYEQVARHLVAAPPPPPLQPPPRRRPPAFRYSGTVDAALAPQAGSFQQLKELLRSERARELQAQRAAEEALLRAAALRPGEAAFLRPLLRDGGPLLRAPPPAHHA